MVRGRWSVVRKWITRAARVRPVEFEAAVELGGEVEAVGDDDQHRAGFALEFEKQVPDAGSGGAIKVAGRFVGQQQNRRTNERAGPQRRAVARRRKVRRGDDRVDC